MLIGIIAGLYCLSGLLFLLSLSLLVKLFRLSWRLPLRILLFPVYLFISVALFLTAQQLKTFVFVSSDAAIAEVTIERLHTEKFLLSLVIEDEKHHRYEVYGDEWQLDCRVLTWHPLVAVFGLDPLFRMERLSGRYQSIESEYTKIRTMYDLGGEALSDSSWQYLIQYLDGSLIRAYFGAALYAPMADGAKYGVYLSDTGLELKPHNDQAVVALRSW